MDPSELLGDAFGRIGPIVNGALEGLDADMMNWRPDGRGNSITWLVWHLCRTQDRQVADVAGIDSVWKAGGYAARFGFDLDPADTGYGHTPEQVAVVRVESADLLLEYHGAVLRQSLAYVRGLADTDLDKVVDRRWSPAVTLGVRLVSILADCLQYGGQAAYVRGLALNDHRH
ncbi:mycothiol transferase [Specibacter sp. RAF43]|uniref:mycothiol transferase n=1 Tax=Specibacter sp. RAF43 TaxID=3233057 RepID=UPI003F9E3CD7